MFKWCLVALFAMLVLVSTFLHAPPCYSTGLSMHDTKRPEISRIQVQGSRPSTSPNPQEGPAISFSLKTERSAYLTGENIRITCTNTGAGNFNWVADSFIITIRADSDDGEIMEVVPEEQLHGTRIYRWTAPARPCSITFTGIGRGTYQTSITTSETVCFGKAGCITVPITTVTDHPLESNALLEIRIYDPVAPISGTVMDRKGKPVPGACVSLNTSGYQPSFADDKGNYSFSDYKLDATYKTDNNNIPYADEIVTVQAIACDTLKQTLSVPATKGIRNANLTMTRYFYPAAMDLSHFTLATFSDWPESVDASVWQNVLGITIKGPADTVKVLQLDREIKTLPFAITSDTLLLIIPKPQQSRYFVDIVAMKDGEFQISTAATIEGKELENSTLKLDARSGETQRAVVVVEKGRLKIERSEGLTVPLIALFTICGLAGGLLVAFLLTGGKISQLKKAPSSVFNSVTSLAGRLTNIRSFKTAATEGTTVLNSKAPETDIKRTTIAKHESSDRQAITKVVAPTSVKTNDDTASSGKSTETMDKPAGATAKHAKKKTRKAAGTDKPAGRKRTVKKKSKESEVEQGNPEDEH